MAPTSKLTGVAHDQAVAPGAPIPFRQLFTDPVASGNSIVGFDVGQTANDGGHSALNEPEQHQEGGSI